MKDFFKNKISGTRLEPFARKVWGKYKVLRNSYNTGATVQMISGPGLQDRDRTGNYDYERLINEEKEHYLGIEVTDRLTEGGKHAGSAWEYYWGRVSENIQKGAGVFGDLVKYLEKTVPSDRKIRVLSLGSGYCGHEIMLAGQFSRQYEILCSDINDELFKEARIKVKQEKLCISFELRDLNFIKIEPGQYDLIFAHAVLHHIINLEYLYEQIAHGLTPEGLFHLIEVAGKNRRLIWEDNQYVANKLLDALPEELVGGQRIDAREEEEGMEGVRQEEILPLLKAYFNTEYEHLHGAFMRYVCLDEYLGKVLTPDNPLGRRYLDFLIDCDESCVQREILQPLEVWGIYRPAGKMLRGRMDTRSSAGVKRVCPGELSLNSFFKTLPVISDQVFSREAQSPQEHQKLPLERLFLFTDVKDKSVLEIGADDPAMLYALKYRGMSRGVGINNWYWENTPERAIRISEDIALSYGDIRWLSFEDESFDLIFTVAAFEHIHELEKAMGEMYRLLKPGGLVYSFFGPLWSSGVGHHLFFERNGVWYRFSDKDSVKPVLDDYEHLLLSREEMKARLKQKWNEEDADAFIYQIYDHPHINRYMYSDYIRIFRSSDFEIRHLANLGKTGITKHIQESLSQRYGRDNDFTCATMEVVLKKNQ